MRDAGRIAAAIEILEDFNRRRVPLKIAIADWARGARYAGAKDRAWISGLCLDVLRKRNSLGAAMGSKTPRALALGAMRFLWGTDVDALSEICAEEPHGPGALADEEIEKLSWQFRHPELDSGSRGDRHKDSPWIPNQVQDDANENEGGNGPRCYENYILGDYPEWLDPHVTRAFGDAAAAEGAALASRADIDLRLNTLKAPLERSLAALKRVKGEAVPMLTTAARIAAPPASEKSAAVTIIPAFNKGWVEVQDLGSQIAAAAAGDIKGKQVLDYCAGGGGKTLALAALMENTGQLFAYDKDARRLKPIYARAKRAGVRNLQIRNPSADETLDGLVGKMDVVFVDAPCTGAGTWRRHPDAKWRLTEKQLTQRMSEQDIVLREAACFVKPGGRMVYVTCSFLMEEGEDRVDAFLAVHRDFERVSTMDQIAVSSLLTQEGGIALGPCLMPDGALKITPARLRADGFFVACLERR